MILAQKNGRSPISRAFTLIEVMIATMIFAAILAAINAVFYGALHLRSKVAKRIENVIPSNHAIAIIKADLRSILVPGGTLAVSITGLAQAPGNNQLQIYTATGVPNEQQPWTQTEPQSWGDVQKISYYLKDSMSATRSGGKDLVRGTTRNLLAPTEQVVSERPLLNNVCLLEFTYYDGTNWRDSWDSTTQQDMPVPKAIKVRLEFARQDRNDQNTPPIELLVPLVMQPSTNSTTTATATGGG